MSELSAAATLDNPAGVDHAVAAFIFREARLADEARYTEWEELWDDDALYWVPMHPDDDPEQRVSYIYDNRRRIKSRVAQLNTGVRHSQTPPSVMRRVLGNLEVLNEDDDTTTVAANFVLHEYRFNLITWAGRYVYRIRRGASGLRLANKTVHLVNAGGPIPTMSFLI
jgi:3-phenylpropionate/cinnamic acid dioxygenase small subunit